MPNRALTVRTPASCDSASQSDTEPGEEVVAGGRRLSGLPIHLVAVVTDRRGADEYGRLLSCFLDGLHDLSRRIKSAVAQGFLAGVIPALINNAFTSQVDDTGSAGDGVGEAVPGRPVDAGQRAVGARISRHGGDADASATELTDQRAAHQTARAGNNYVHVVAPVLAASLHSSRASAAQVRSHRVEPVHTPDQVDLAAVTVEVRTEVQRD